MGRDMLERRVGVSRARKLLSEGKWVETADFARTWRCPVFESDDDRLLVLCKDWAWLVIGAREYRTCQLETRYVPTHFLDVPGWTGGSDFPLSARGCVLLACQSRNLPCSDPPTAIDTSRLMASLDSQVRRARSRARRALLPNDPHFLTPMIAAVGCSILQRLEGCAWEMAYNSEVGQSEVWEPWIRRGTRRFGLWIQPLKMFINRETYFPELEYFVRDGIQRLGGSLD